MYKISGLPTSFAVRKMELRLSSSQQELLKWVAIVLMVLDHVGFFLEQYAWLRFVGRVVYPIFAFLVAYNYLHNTRNKEGYLKRLFFWALISQPIYMLAMGASLNILFTILLGMLVVYVFENQKPYALLLCVLLIPIAFVTSYGIAGVMLVPSFYFLLKNIKFAPLLAFTLAFLNAPKYLLFTALSIPLIALVARFNGTIGRTSGVFFYAFYPAHLAVLWLVFV